MAFRAAGSQRPYTCTESCSSVIRSDTHTAVAAGERGGPQQLQLDADRRRAGSRQHREEENQRMHHAPFKLLPQRRQSKKRKWLAPVRDGHRKNNTHLCSCWHSAEGSISGALSLSLPLCSSLVLVCPDDDFSSRTVFGLAAKLTRHRCAVATSPLYYYLSCRRGKRRKRSSRNHTCSSGMIFLSSTNIFVHASRCVAGIGPRRCSVQR